jgi:hypothetical protein
MPRHWSKERVPDELRDYLEGVFDAYDNIVFDWPTEYRQIGEQGMAEQVTRQMSQGGLRASYQSKYNQPMMEDYLEEARS